MEILQDSLLNLIREQCSSYWELSVFKDHIIVNLPDMEEDYRAVYNKAKREIIACVKQHFPERNTDLLFEVRNGSWNCSFKLSKTTLTDT
ncbi:MAG TPA: hypothetical protein VGC01_12850 [Mucilaginibacter sp.]